MIDIISPRKKTIRYGFYDNTLLDILIDEYVSQRTSIS